MKAMRLEQYGGPLRLRDLPVPEPGPGEVLVKVAACGVCRTDLKILRGEIPPPIVNLPHTMGHEIAGRIEALGPGVDGMSAGDRVVVYFYINCGHCEMCLKDRGNICMEIKRLGFELPGAYAEYVAVPASHVIPIGDLDFTQTAILPDAVAVPYHAIRRQAKVEPGQDVLIVGVGGLGVHAVQIAKLEGARVIAADVDPERLDLARKLGADDTVDAAASGALEQVKSLTNGAGVDSVIEIVGTPETLAWTLPATKRGGRLIIVGYAPGRPWPVDTMAMHYNEWEILGSRTETKTELAEVVGLVRDGKLKPMVSRKFALADANEALAEVASGRVPGRCVLTVGI
ncbi:MAG TPA: alcohol dehydrogenase catalytic domain-containing protein [Chloroflexota bacterium]